MLKEILFSLNTLTVTPITGEVTDLSPKLVWVEDHQGDMTLTQFSQAIARGDYHRPEGDAPNLGYVHHPVFFAVPIENHTGYDHFVLNIAYPLLDEVTFHVVTDHGISPPVTSGDHLLFSQRFRPYRTINFKLDLNESARANLVLRIKSESAMQVQVKLHTEANFGDTISGESMILGLYYGLNLVMILYNSFLYFSLRMRSYLYYVGYLALNLLFQAGLHGVVFQTFFPNNPGLNDKMLWVWACFGFVFAYLFALHFHELRTRQPRLARVAKVMIWTHIVFLGFSFVLPYYIVAWLGTFLVAVVNSLMMLVIGYMSLHYGYRPARYFAIGWSVLIVGNVIYGLKSFGIFPSHLLIDHALLIGSSLEVILLSLALGDRVNMLQQERDEASQAVIDANQAMIDGYSRLQAEIDRREELEKQKEILGEEIRQATEQLIQADKMSSMGQIVAGVAHDIANPTQLIINSRLDALKTVGAIEERLNALLEGDDPEVVSVRNSFTGDISQTKSSLQDISTAVGRIEAIQSAIRNQTRVDSKPSVVQLRPLIEECFTILRSKLKPLQLGVECTEGLMLECRRSQLGQVLTNLLSNAADALNEKGVQWSQSRTEPHLLVRAAMEADAKGDTIIAIEIEDDGPGIAVDKAEKIFKPFFTTKGVGVGTGLGLSICQKIISSHGGTITLREPRRLHGACFRLEIPIVALHDVA
jgi:signal transduction histidine kinase